MLANLFAIAMPLSTIRLVVSGVLVYPVPPLGSGIDYLQVIAVLEESDFMTAVPSPYRLTCPSSWVN